MRDLIDRQAAIDAIDAVFPVDPTMSEYVRGITCGAALAKTYIKQLPTIEPERKKGKWNFTGDNMFECTYCGVVYTTQQLNGLRNYDVDPYAPKFCPNCGADMR